MIRVEGGMSMIISKELFQQVQDKMDANKHAPGRQKAKELLPSKWAYDLRRMLEEPWLRLRNDGQYKALRT
ncbi:hypothetical protein MHH52_16350 [Paenibacillus sp. FSL K6-0276]|uniref:hypothetical protein n=1 Tax=Paenibacillus sp. FSL K6-0276 TaxID=2921450 RepID=UPI0030EB93E4